MTGQVKPHLPYVILQRRRGSKETLRPVTHPLHERMTMESALEKAEGYVQHNPKNEFLIMAPVRIVRERAPDRPTVLTEVLDVDQQDQQA